MNTPTPSDGEHDAWLVQALRHAPDADAQPPQDLSDTILRQARQACDSAAARPTRAPRPGIVATLWSWLARPQLTGALASVLVLAFAGVMWMHQPVEQVVHDSMALRESAAPAEARKEDRSAALPAAAPAPSAVASADSLRPRSSAEGKLSTSSAKPAVPDRERMTAAAKATKEERSFAQVAVAPRVVEPAPLQTPPPAPVTAPAPAAITASPLAPLAPLAPAAAPAPVLGSVDTASPAPAVVAAAPSSDSFLERRAPVGAAAPILVAPPAPAAALTAPAMKPAPPAPAAMAGPAAPTVVAPPAPAAPVVIAMKTAPPQPAAATAKMRADAMDTRQSTTELSAAARANNQDRRESNAAVAAAPPPPRAALASSAEPSALMFDKQTVPASVAPPVIARDASVAERRARTGPSPMAAVVGEIAQNPSRWTALRGAGATQPMSDALQRWLARVSTAAAAQWQPAAAAHGGALTEVTRLTLLRDGVPRLSVGWIGDVVRIDPLTSEGSAQQAQLPAARARELQDALPRIVR